MDFSKWIKKAEREPTIWGWITSDNLFSVFNFERNVSNIEKDILNNMKLNEPRLMGWGWNNTDSFSKMTGEEFNIVEQIFNKSLPFFATQNDINMMENIDLSIGLRK